MEWKGEGHDNNLKKSEKEDLDQRRINIHKKATVPLSNSSIIPVQTRLFAWVNKHSREMERITYITQV
jgi:hypothetical protein